MSPLRVFRRSWPLIAIAGTAAAQTPQSRPLPSVQVTPDQLTWFPYPLGGMQAYIVGNPTQPGPYVVRVRFPAGLRVMPHTHPDGRIVTVISGTMAFSFGEQFDEATLKAFPEGSVWTETPSQPHYAMSRTEVVLQIVGTGPSGMTMIPQHP